LLTEVDYRQTRRHTDKRGYIIGRRATSNIVIITNNNNNDTCAKSNGAVRASYYPANSLKTTRPCVCPSVVNMHMPESVTEWRCENEQYDD